MPLDFDRIRTLLKGFNFDTLFIEELGWDRHAGGLSVRADENMYTLEGVAEKRGVQIFSCQPDPNGMIPDYATRLKIEKQVTKSAYEHLIIFIDADQTMQIWQWVSRQPGQPTAYREHHYQARHHSGDSLIQKLEAITFTLNEEEGLTLTGVVFRLHDVFYRDRVTKRFYDLFKQEHKAFLDFIQGITEQGDREWYASLMLNRLMFVYFIQRKGFLDSDIDYLENRLKLVQERKGKDNFMTFYRYFLIRLFHEGFSQQPSQWAPNLEELLGQVPYLDGGLFELHELEQNHPDIDIPDEAFEQLFDFFDQYEWTLDTRALRNDREINPDVLGYIFEKYINQKQMGAYYTKEDITDYISKNTIIPYLFDAAEKKCAIAFQPDSALWQLLRNEPDRYIFPAVRKGVIGENGDVIPLPDEIEKGIRNVKERGGWNHPAEPEYSLPTEIWREHVARRQRCLEVREKLSRGDVHEINDLITYNLDIRQFAQDVITNCEGPELLRAFYKAISTVTILDPTCGSGAFLFAALNILEPLYEACLDRMQAFLDDLDRSGKRHSPEKFSDFRKTLAEIEKHPNRPYFIFKSIIVNNLYGVDIMQEAVEICKLRLFLKLVAQVDKVKHLEPLPDIDFNIRAGNTLVGFARLDDVKRTLDGKFEFMKGQVDQISEEAEFFVHRAYRRFHEMQTAQNMDVRDFSDTKRELRARLAHLTEQLDRYLSTEYGISESIIPDENKYEEAFQQWRISHQPFHWFAEFYGIMHAGGFDVVIGNPPYVEYSKVKNEYKIKDFITDKCGNLYAYVIERCFKILCRSGRFSMIVQLPIVCTDRMLPLQKMSLLNSSSIWFANFDDRPARLFDGLEHIRATIFLSKKDRHGGQDIFSTTYNRWYSEVRPSLFSLISFVSISELLIEGVIPKIGNPLAVSIMKKIVSLKCLGNYLDKFSSNRIYFHNAPQYWIRAMDFVPFFWNERKGKHISTQVKSLTLRSKLDASVVVSVLNSSLFYWWFLIRSDCRHLNMREIVSFPIEVNGIDLTIKKALSNSAKLLMNDLKGNSKLKECYYKTTGKVKYDEYFPKYSKPIIDQIDNVLSDYYGFTGEEQDFIINYDFKYRMGHNSEE